MFGRRHLVQCPGSALRRAATAVALVLVAVLVPVSASSAQGEGPKIGDHWHLAFGVWNCGTWEPPVTPGDDPLGIHTHGDGLIHVHPFEAAAAGKNAVLGRFLAVSQATLTSSSLALPTKKLIAGGTCQGKRAVVRTLTWSSKAVKVPTVVSGDANKVPLRDEEIIVIAYGPSDAKVGLPPSVAELEDPADLPPPPLSAKDLAGLPTPPASVPSVVTTGKAPSALRIVDRVVGTGTGLKRGARPYVRFALYLWRTGELLDASSWKRGEQPLALSRLGNGRLLPGLEKGLLGMKMGGIREIVMPPADGFGPDGAPPVLGTDTMVMVLQLVSVTK